MLLCYYGEINSLGFPCLVPGCPLSLAAAALSAVLLGEQSYSLLSCYRHSVSLCLVQEGELSCSHVASSWTQPHGATLGEVGRRDHLVACCTRPVPACRHTWGTCGASSRDPRRPPLGTEGGSATHVCVLCPDLSRQSL